VVEGPIGVGKTSLVERLWSGWGRESSWRWPTTIVSGRLLQGCAAVCVSGADLVPVESVPAAAGAGQWDLVRQALVVDYLLAKDKIFAYLTLEDHELACTSGSCAAPGAGAGPDLVIFLQASSEALADSHRPPRQTVRARDRPDLAGGAERATLILLPLHRSPLLVVNTSDIDSSNGGRLRGSGESGP